MGCCQSGRQATQGTAVTDGTRGGGGGQSITTGNRSGSPSAAAIAASMCISSNRRNDEMDETRRNYLQGRLKVDENCPLTDRQLYGLIKSWKAINRNMSVTAMNMFVR